MDEAAIICILILVGLLFGNWVAERLEQRSKLLEMKAHLAYLDLCIAERERELGEKEERERSEAKRDSA